MNARAFNGDQLASVLYGLQGFSSKRDVVRKIIRQVALKVSERESPIKNLNLGRVFYGLKRMESEHEDVTALIGQLRLHIRESTLQLTAEELGDALYGMRNMNSVQETRGYLSIYSQHGCA